MRIIAGSARGRKLIAPSDRSIRPALDHVRESLFSILDDSVYGARVLDLFAGVGAFGLEALSRGARHATFVDRSREAISILQRNIENLGFQRQTTCLLGDALTVPEIDAAHAPYDLTFLDPPFADFDDEGRAERVFTRVRELLGPQATADEVLVVLRLPARRAGSLPFPARDERSFGGSIIAILDRGSLKP